MLVGAIWNLGMTRTIRFYGNLYLEVAAIYGKLMSGVWMELVD